jgi:hypothetical protein
MNRHQFWNVVPHPAKATALTILVLGVLIGLVVGIVQAPAGNVPVALSALLGTGAGLLAGSLIGFWIVCLGYVYADAQWRGMPAVPWTLIAAFVPNLLGFLFYFALRRPLILPCPQCGQPIYTGQRFCASCGFNTLSTTSGGAPSSPRQEGLDANLI